jgi:Tol biopolymer transport system component
MSLEWVGLAQSNADLIPRSVLFDLSERKEMIQLSPDGKKVFFIKNPYQGLPDNSIYYCETKNPEKEKKMEFEGGVESFKPMDASRVLVRIIQPEGQKVLVWDLNNQSVQALFPDDFRRIQWLAFSKNGKKVAFVALPKSGQPLLFIQNLETGTRDSLKNQAQGHFPLFFNKNLEIIAGEKTDPATGILYLDIFKNGNWETIQQYDWSAERFLRPGLQSIVSVNDEGTEVFLRIIRKQTKRN